MGCTRIESKEEKERKAQEADVDYLLDSYSYAGCPAEGVLIYKIKASLVEYDQIFKLCFQRAQHMEKMRQAALAKFLPMIHDHNTAGAEKIYRKAWPEYTSADSIAEKILLATIRDGKLSIATLQSISYDRANHHEAASKAAVEQLKKALPKCSAPEVELVVNKALLEYYASGTPAEQILVAAIRTGKLMISTLRAIGFDRADHRAAARDAAVAQFKQKFAQISPQQVEAVVKEAFKEYYTYGVPAEKVIIHAINSGKLSEKTLLDMTRDNTLHHAAVNKAARKALHV